MSPVCIKNGQTIYIIGKVTFQGYGGGCKLEIVQKSCCFGCGAD